MEFQGLKYKMFDGCLDMNKKGGNKLKLTDNGYEVKGENGVNDSVQSKLAMKNGFEDDSRYYSKIIFEKIPQYLRVSVSQKLPKYTGNPRDDFDFIYETSLGEHYISDKQVYANQPNKTKNTVEMYSDLPGGNLNFVIDGVSKGALVENNDLLKSGKEFYLTFWMYGEASFKIVKPG